MTDILPTVNPSNTSEVPEAQRDIVATSADIIGDTSSDNSRDNTPCESKQSSPAIRSGPIDEDEDFVNDSDSHNDIISTFMLPRGKLTKPTVVQKPPKTGGR